MKYLHHRSAGLSFLYAGSFLVVIAGAAADSISVGETTYEDVLVVSGDLSYYVLLPDEGRTLSIPRQEVDESQVIISEDENHRATLRRRYVAASQGRDVSNAASLREPDRTRRPRGSQNRNSEQYNESAGLDAPELSILEVLKEGPLSPRDASIRVVEFWATWCGPCLQSIPHLTALQAKYASKGVAFFGVTGERPDVAAPYVTNMGGNMNYTVLADYQSQTSRAYARLFGVTTIPHAYIVDENGKIVWHGHPMARDFMATLDRLTQ